MEPTVRNVYLISLLTISACVADELNTDEVSSEIGKDVITTPPPPPTNTPPPNGSNVLRVSSADLYQSLWFALNGTKLSVDTTETAPWVLGPVETVCYWPNEAIREAAQAECRADYSGSDLMDCLLQVNVDYPNYHECRDGRFPKYSYVDFAPGGATAGIPDITFDFEQIHKELVVGSVNVDVHWIHTDTNFISSAAFGTSSSPGPAAVLTLPLTSPYPTLYCYHSSLICPDINMWNMKVTARVTSIAAGAPMQCPNNAGTPPFGCTAGSAVGAQLGFSTVQPTFTFDRNINNVPDFVITALVDVDAKIKNAFESNIKSALEGRGRAAVSSVLTSVALQQARITHPTIQGFSRIRGTWFDSGSLVVQYDWY